MICCLCGREFGVGEVVVRVTVHKVTAGPRLGLPTLEEELMEDGSDEKLACLVCPVQYGAPMALIGCDINDRTDV